MDVIQSYSNEMNIHIIRFQRNRGVTEAFREGFKWVCDKGADSDLCITFEADNTNDPYVMLDIIKKFNQGYDVVIASRFQEGGGMVGVPKIRYFLSCAVSFILRTFFPIPGVRDFSIFYRGYRVGVLRQAMETFGEDFLRGEGFTSVFTV